MGRPERVIDPTAGPLEQFAYDLRALRRTADGSPTLRQLEVRSGYSKAALSQACSGRSLPTLELTLAYAGACGADMTAWEARWRELAALLRATHPELIPPEVDTDPQDGSDTAPAQPQPGDASPPDPDPDPDTDPDTDLDTDPDTDPDTDSSAEIAAETPVPRQPPAAVLPLRRSDPRRLGDHVLLGVLGSGGSGRVYLAKSPAGLPLAIKAIRPEYADSAAFRDRFRHELAAARQVQTQHGVPIIDADAEAEQPWMAAACITGPSLEQAVSEHGPLPEPAIRTLAARLAEALADLHRAGVVHRDLKPGNVLLDADGPRLIDFGVAHIAAATRLTTAGARLGTPAFIAPEQIADGAVGPAADVFALGALLFFAATGAPPFGDGSPQVLFTRVVHTEPDLDNLAHLAPELRELISACLNKNPDDRPDTTAIIAAAGGQSPQPDWLPPRVTEAAAERRRQIGAALAALPAIDPDEADESPDAASPLARTRQLHRRSVAVPILIAATIIAALLLAIPHDKHPMAVGPDTLPSATSSDPDGGPTGDSDTTGPSDTASSGTAASAPVKPGSAPAAIPPPQSSSTALGPANTPGPSTVTLRQTSTSAPAPPQSTAPSTRPSSAPASPATTAAPAVPPIPSGWKVQATSSKTIEGVWNDIDTTATYVIEDEKGNRVTNVGPGVQYHAFGSLYSGYTLCLRIKTVENGLESAWSATLCAETP